MTEQEEGIADRSTTSLQTLIKQYAGCEERGAKPGLRGIIFTHFVLCPRHFTLSALKKDKHFLV